MKKLITLIMLISALIYAQDVETKKMRFMKISRPTKIGIDSNFWIITYGKIRIGTDSAIELEVKSYANEEAFITGKNELQSDKIQIDKLERFQFYELMINELSGEIFKKDDFKGANLSTFEYCLHKNQYKIMTPELKAILEAEKEAKNIKSMKNG